MYKTCFIAFLKTYLTTVLEHCTGNLCNFKHICTTVANYTRPKKKKNTLVSGNLHPDGRKFIFFNQFSGDYFFSSLVPFALFFFILAFFLFICSLFFEIKNVYSDTHSTIFYLIFIIRIKPAADRVC